MDLGNVIELFPGDDDVLVGLNSFLLALNPFDAEAYWRRGRLYGLRRDSEKAIADYTMTLALLSPQDPRRAEIIARRAANYMRLQDKARMLADLEQVVKLDLGEFCGLHAEFAQMCNDTARRLVTGSEKERNPARALPPAEKAVALTPELSLYHGTLALVYYRLGEYRKATELLERSRSSEPTPALDGFILAMSYAHLGDGAWASDYYHRAATELREHRGQLPTAQGTELEALQAEAEAVLSQLAKF